MDWILEGVERMHGMKVLIRNFLAIHFCFPLLAFAQPTGAPAGPAALPQARSVTADQAPALSQREAPAPDETQGRIQLEVVVTDKQGKTVSGLELKDFTLLDNNQPVKILSFHASGGTGGKTDTPVEVILLIDTVNVDFKYVSFVRQEMEKYLGRNGGHLLQPVSIFVYTNTGLDAGSGPSTDGNALAREVSQLDNHLRTVGPGEGVNGAIERFYASIKAIAAIAQSEAVKPGRKLLIWAGPGWPMLNSVNVEVSLNAQRQNFDSIVGLSTMLRQARVSVYSISSTDPGVGASAYRGYLKGVKSAAKSDPDDLALKVLAIQSGGRVLGPDNNMAAQIDSCVEDAGSFYTLSFDPPRADHANEYHDLKVLIARPELTARTNTGYYNQP
jgi:VWFA-related protein